MSINPIFADRILDGSKQVEFRKTRFASKVSHVLIYATTPVQQIVGYFSVDSIIEGAPADLWEEFNHVSGTDSGFYFSYFDSSNVAIGIKVREVCALDSPISLEVVGLEGPPPQSFRYVPESIFEKVTALCQ